MTPYRTIRIVHIITNLGVLLVQLVGSIAVEEQARVNHHMNMAAAVVAGVCIYLVFRLPAISALIALAWATRDETARRLALILNVLWACYAVMYSTTAVGDIRATWQMTTFWKFVGLGLVFSLHALAPAVAVIALLSARWRRNSAA